MVVVGGGVFDECGVGVLLLDGCVVVWEIIVENLFLFGGVGTFLSFSFLIVCCGCGCGGDAIQ